MKKFSIIFYVIFIINCFILSAYAEGVGLSNFGNKNMYTNGQFRDIPTNEWYVSNVKSAYELGLMNGTGPDTFNPAGNVTIAESIVLACRIHSIYHTGSASFEQGDPWYKFYVEYAVENGIIGALEYYYYDMPATRAQFASILSASLPDSALEPINGIFYGAIPDIPDSATYASNVYKLYNAGILTGNDEYGTFTPDSNIERSAVAAIATRMVDTTLRKKVSLKTLASKPNDTELSAQQIAEKCSSSVFFIETYGLNGEPKGTGSGFFITSSGVAVTNHHVVANGIHFEVVTSDEKTYDKVKIIDIDKQNDLALIKVEGEGFPYLKIGDSNAVSQGQQVIAIGSPLGLANTMSQGIISNPKRTLGGIDYIQISVPINHGSSGGALIDTYGNAIGVTSGGADTTGDINLAVPIEKVKYLDKYSTADYTVWEDNYYPGFEQVLDFGEFSGTKLLSAEKTSIGYILNYDAFDFHDAGDMPAGDCFAYTVYLYGYALEENGMTYKSVSDNLFVCESDTEKVVFRMDLTNDRKITVTASRKPQYYELEPVVPDFGWYSGLPLSAEPYFEGFSTVYSYRWIDYYYRDDFEELLYEYFDYLRELGFEYKYSENNAHLFEGNKYSIVVNLKETEVYIDIQDML